MARWLLGAAATWMLMGMYSVSVPGGASDDTGFSLMLVLLLLSALVSGMMIGHWTAGIVVPAAFWLYILVGAAIYTRSVQPLLPGNWIESLGEIGFFLLLPIGLTALLGAGIRFVIRPVPR